MLLPPTAETWTGDSSLNGGGLVVPQEEALAWQGGGDTAGGVNETTRWHRVTLYCTSKGKLKYRHRVESDARAYTDARTERSMVALCNKTRSYFLLVYLPDYFTLFIFYNFI